VWLYSVRCIHDKFAQLILYIRNRITAGISGTTVDGQRRMLRAKKPCRQLNSEAIKSAALCYLTPVISGKCSIISAKCVCNVKEKALPKTWSSICKKRDACDRAISG